MVPGKETAEEQLLRMIEGSAAPKPPARDPKSSSSLQQITEQVKHQVEQLRRWAMPPPKASTDALLQRLRLIERLLWLLLIGLGCYMVWSLWLVQRQPPPLSNATVPTTAPTSASQ